MPSNNAAPFSNEQTYFSAIKKFVPWSLYILLPLAIVVHLYFFSNPLSLLTSDDILPQYTGGKECDYTNGIWVKDKLGPLYNGTSCDTIKENQNCMKHGKPDLNYLYWRWSPKECKLPRFDPNIFLQIFQNKHMAFVGDSMARNQLESLLCMLASFSSPKLVYSKGEDNEFRRWHIDSHNITVSVYWSPFLVKGIEKNKVENYNQLFLDSVDDKWANELDQIDMIVLSVGHWFLQPAVFYDGNLVLGCHFCKGLNHSEVGFYDTYSMAINTTLKTIIERRSEQRKGIHVVLTSFSPHHFEGEWDHYGACPRIRPYLESEKKLEGMDLEMRDAGIYEVDAARKKAKYYWRLQFRALDVTKLSLLRPDGHPGPYMYNNPFANGIRAKVQNDCVHWCLPGPVDTWNEILLDIMRRWAYGLS